MSKNFITPFVHFPGFQTGCPSLPKKSWVKRGYSWTRTTSFLCATAYPLIYSSILWTLIPLIFLFSLTLVLNVLRFGGE